MYEVIQFIGTNYSNYDEVPLGQFDTLAEAEDFIYERFGDDTEDLSIMDPWGDVAW